MKSEIKMEMENTKFLKSFLEKSYRKGKHIGNKDPLVIDKFIDPGFFLSLHEMDNIVIRVMNKDIIDVFLRAIVEQGKKEIRVYPISINFTEDDGRYNFF